jgi:NarL family two-component system response regulator LiaR
MNPSHSPSPSSPTGPDRHKGTSKPLAVPLGKVGVALVDDDENFSVFLRDVLDQMRQLQCVGSYSSGEAALTGVPQSGAQVVLMDIKMPGMSGIECARRLKALLPHLIIVMVTGLDDPRTIALARECGADRFLPKPFTAGHLLATLSFCVPRSKVETAKRPQSGKRARQPGLCGRSLTDRENELMQLLSEGLQYKEIADKWGVSVSAVHGMQHRVFQKLGVTNARKAIRKWQEIPRDSGDGFR